MRVYSDMSLLRVEQERYIHMYLNHSEISFEPEDFSQISKILYITPQIARKYQKPAKTDAVCTCKGRTYGYLNSDAQKYQQKLKFWDYQVQAA